MSLTLYLSMLYINIYAINTIVQNCFYNTEKIISIKKTALIFSNIDL